MRVISYKKDGNSGVGVVVGENGVIPLNEALPDFSDGLKEILAVDPKLEKVRSVTDGKEPSFTIDNVILDPVIPDRRQFERYRGRWKNKSR